MKCAICGKEIKGVGHNPSPFRGTRCCDECNKYVIIARGFLSGLQTNMIMILGTDNSVSFQLNRTKENVTLKELQKLAGGFIEMYPLEDDKFYYIVDEEGLLKERPYNELANDLFGIDVVGNLLVVPKQLMN